MHVRPSLTLTAMVAAGLLAAIACQPATVPSATTAATTAASAASPVAGAATPAAKATAAAPGKRSGTPADTVVVGTNRSPDTLDPHIFFSDAWPEPHYLYLVSSVDEKFVPELAASWRYLDPSRLQFVLRDDIRFEDGAVVNAADVKASFDRVNDPQFTAGAQVRQFIRGLTGVSVDDNKTVTVTATGPDPLIAARLWRVGIMSRDWLSKTPVGLISTTANGNGPYKVTEFIPKTRIVAEQRADSPLKAASSKFVLQSLPEYASRVAALRSGQVDLIEEVSADDVKPLQADGFTVESFRRASGIALGILPDAQFQDIRVRQAMDLAIDRNAIVNNVYEGSASILQSQPPQLGLVGYNPTIRAELDLPRARQLMAAAGMPNGFQATLRYPPQNAPMTTIAQTLPGMFQQIGINLQLEAVEQAIFLQRGQQNPNGNGPLYMALSSFLVPDASWHLTFWRTPNNRGFTNPAFNPLLDRSQQELDPAARERQLQEMVKLVSDEKLFLYIVAPGATASWYPNISGFKIGLTGFQRYFDLAKSR